MVEDIFPHLSNMSDIQTQSANDTIGKGLASSADFLAFDIPSNMHVNSTMPMSNEGIPNSFFFDLPSLDHADVKNEWPESIL